MGDFVLPRDDSIPLVFIAGGIGITPFHSIIGNLKDKSEKRQIQLFYGARNLDELVFEKELKEYGVENFVYEILEEIKQTDDKPIDYIKEVKALEEMMIEDLQPYENKGYHKREI